MEASWCGRCTSRGFARAGSSLICLTDLPLHARGRPVTAYASPTHRVGLVSVPALGAVDVERRVGGAVLRLVEGLVRGRPEELASSLGQPQVMHSGTVGFVTAAIRGNLRLLVGMVRANDPARVIVRLSRALTAALGTAAIALANISVWQLSDGMTWPRLLVLTVASAVVTVLALILAHGLWERREPAKAREQIVLFNVVTALTLIIGVLALSGALFGINVAAGGRAHPTGGAREAARSRNRLRPLSAARLARQLARDGRRGAWLRRRERLRGPRGDLPLPAGRGR
jgi:hypothetical protein